MHTLAAIQLAAPLMLVGALAVGLPIAAHLLHRRAVRRVVFPSVALLAATAAGQSSLHRLRRRLLLVLRCLAVLLLALAFAQPSWFPGKPGDSHPPALSASGGTSGATSGGERVVFLLDVSASTRQRLGTNSTAATDLRTAALRELDALRPGRDAVGIIFVSARPTAVFDHLTLNHAALRSALAQAEPTDQRADFAAGLTLAMRLLHASTDARGPIRLVLFTDAQRTNWDQPRTMPLPPDATLDLRTLDAAAPPDNTALHHPAARPPSPPLHSPVELSVEVAHFSDAPARLHVDLEIDGRAIDSRWIRIEARGRQRVAFTHRFDHAADHAVRFTLSADDAMPADNAAHLVVRPAERYPVVVIGSDHPNEPGTASYYLTRALAPRDAPPDRYRVTHLAPSAVTPAMLAGAALVCVTDVEGDPRRLAEALRAYAEAGGGVLAFAGEHPLRDESLLPWSLSTRQSAVQVSGGDFAAPELAGFDAAAQSSLLAAGLGNVWRTRLLTDDARVLLRIGRDVPALAVRPLGQGKVIAAAFSPDASTGPLGRYGIFVVFVQSLADHLTMSQPATPATPAGSPLRIAAQSEIDPQGQPAQVIGPDGEPLPDALLTFTGSTPTAQVPAAPAAGFYELRQGPARLGLAAANLDPRESDPQPLDLAMLRQTLADAGHTRVSANRLDTEARHGEARQGQPLWGYALLAVLATLCLEMLVLISPRLTRGAAGNKPRGAMP